jgi:hypothetical protein
MKHPGLDRLGFLTATVQDYLGLFKKTYGHDNFAMSNTNRPIIVYIF